MAWMRRVSGVRTVKKRVAWVVTPAWQKYKNIGRYHSAANQVKNGTNIRPYQHSQSTLGPRDGYSLRSFYATVYATWQVRDFVVLC